MDKTNFSSQISISFWYIQYLVRRVSALLSEFPVLGIWSIMEILRSDNSTCNRVVAPFWPYCDTSTRSDHWSNLEAE